MYVRDKRHINALCGGRFSSKRDIDISNKNQIHVFHYGSDLFYYDPEYDCTSGRKKSFEFFSKKNHVSNEGPIHMTKAIYQYQQLAWSMSIVDTEI